MSALLKLFSAKSNNDGIEEEIVARKTELAKLIAENNSIREEIDVQENLIREANEKLVECHQTPVNHRGPQTQRFIGAYDVSGLLSYTNPAVHAYESNIYALEDVRNQIELRNKEILENRKILKEKKSLTAEANRKLDECEENVFVPPSEARNIFEKHSQTASARSSGQA